MRITVSVLLLLPISAIAAPFADYTFKSPAFNGNGYGTYVLTSENETYTRAQAIQQALQSAAQQAKASASTTPINQFLTNLESRIYAQISQNLATAMFSPGSSTSGSINFEGNTIFWQNQGTTVRLQVTDNLGNITNINVPLGQFTFITPSN